MSVLSDESLALLFLDARTHNGWQDRPVEDALLKRLYEVARMAPTSANTNPMRVVFVKSEAAKARLLPAVAEGNVEKTKAAPVTAIIAYDTKFYDEMPKLFPARDMRPMLSGMPEAAQAAFALLNSSLQGGYLILAARALGLDCGPMAGFDKAKVDAAFFADGRFKSTFLINLGYGDASKLWPRNPRLSFEEACKIE